MALTLAIERSVSPGSWAVYQDGEPLASGLFSGTTPRAPAWMAELTTALDELGAVPTRLTELVVGSGPGSFSGIRSAIAALQGVALPQALPLYGLSSAAVLADASLRRKRSESVAVIGDARRGRLWCAVYCHNAAGQLVMAASRRPPSHSNDDFTLPTQQALREAIPSKAQIVTPDGTRLTAILKQLCQQGYAPAECSLPTALALGALFFADRAAARRNPLPVYLHPAVSGEA